MIKILFVGLVLYSIGPIDCYAAIDNSRLADEITQVLKKHYPLHDVRKSSLYIAVNASDRATDYDSLCGNLRSVFLNPDPNLKWLKSSDPRHALLLKNLASEIAYLEFQTRSSSSAKAQEALDASRSASAAAAAAANAAQTALTPSQPPATDERNNDRVEIPSIPPSTPSAVSAAQSAASAAQSAAAAAKAATEAAQAAMNAPGTIGAQNPVTGDAARTNNIYGQFSIWTGAKFSNPFSIKDRTLSAAGNTSDGYIELNLSSRYVLRQGDDASDIVWTSLGTKTPEDGHLHPVNPIAHMWDVDTRLGYLFRGNTAQSNFNSSTIVGSADFYADTSVGLPILRYCSEDNFWKHQVSIELNGGFASDKTHLDLHPNAFFGLGWQASFFVNQTNQAYWLGRAGYALLDQPVLISGTNTVQFNNLQQPEFRLRWAPSMGIIAAYPVTSSLSVQAGANAYFTERLPASWNATLGVTMDLGKFFSALK